VACLEQYNLPEPYFVRTLDVRVTAWGLGKITRIGVVVMLSQKIMSSGRNIEDNFKQEHLLNSHLLRNSQKDIIFSILTCS
jgi:hypothetical protein